jgi:tRNA pseudouridine32 synthase/23S rRNA pseudouridine746 synthase
MPTSGILILTKQKRSQQNSTKSLYKEPKRVALLAGNLSEKSGTVQLPLRVDLDDRPKQLVDFVHGKEN